MPSSRPEAIPFICNRIIDLKPKSVLDVGCGFGKFGLLAREYTDIWEGRYDPDKWETDIDAIEIWEPYIREHHWYIYDYVMKGDAVVKLMDVCDYDLIICSDMLEHLDRDDGIILLDRMRKKGKTTIVTTPRVMSPQGAKFGNLAEMHRTQWTEEQLGLRGDVTVAGNTLILEMVK